MNSKNRRPLILISNDDGYEAKGINTLAEIARKYGDVIVVAPDGPRSGASLSVTFNNIITTKLIKQDQGLQIFSCSGTPGDCIKMGIANICRQTPDLILGGINHGDNSAVNVHYSGTMGIVIEGCMKGIPSIGFSYCAHNANANFTPMRPYIEKIIDSVLTDGLPKGVCLNVNAPDITSYKGIKVCAMGNGIWKNEWNKRTSPRGLDYYWLVGEFESTDSVNDETDHVYLSKGYVTVTPTKIDITAYETYEALKKRLE